MMPKGSFLLMVSLVFAFGAAFGAVVAGVAGSLRADDRIAEVVAECEMRVSREQEACNSDIARARAECHAFRSACHATVDAARLEHRKLSDLLADCRGVDVGQSGWQQ